MCTLQPQPRLADSVEANGLLGGLWIGGLGGRLGIGPTGSCAVSGSNRFFTDGWLQPDVALRQTQPCWTAMQM